MKLTKLLPFFSPGKEKKADACEAERGGIFLPADRKIGSCMTHRSDIVWIDSAAETDGIRKIIQEHPDFTQFPVCSGSVDKVLGSVTIRNIQENMLSLKRPALREIVRKPIFLSETVTILNALKALEASNCRLAFIIDEYGGIEGIVTRNGLIGELLDEVRKDGDEEDSLPREGADGSRYLEGQTRMEDILEAFELPEVEENRGEYYTLAGFLLNANGSIPKTGDVIEAGDYRWEVVRMDGNRIDRVRVMQKRPDFGAADA